MGARTRRRSRWWTAYDLAMFDLDGVVYIGEERRARRARAPRAGARAAGCTSPSSPTTPPGRPTAVVEKLAGIGVRRVRGRRRDLGAGGGAGAVRALRRRRAGGGPGRGRPRGGVARRGARAGGGDRRAVPVALVTGYGPDVVWRDVMRAAVLSPRRAAVGGQQRRPVAADAVRRGARPRGDGGPARAVQRRPGRRGRQAAATAARRDGAPGGRRAAADGRRPARHRHRGRPRGRGGLAAGADRGDRAGRPGGGRTAAAADVPLGRPGRPVRAARRARSETGTPGRRVAGGPGWPTVASRCPATGDPDDWWRAVGDARPGSTSTTPARPADVAGLAAPRRPTETPRKVASST